MTPHAKGPFGTLAAIISTTAAVDFFEPEKLGTLPTCRIVKKSVGEKPAALEVAPVVWWRLGGGCGFVG
jgi:hypothetical protein